MTIVAIDPGSCSGAICIGEAEPRVVLNMPETLEEVWATVSTWRGSMATVVLEDVGGSRPGNSARSARTFAEHCGALKMALVAAGFTAADRLCSGSYYLVSPSRWIPEFCMGRQPRGVKGYAERKNYIYSRVQMRDPRGKVTKRQADAVALWLWAADKVRQARRRE
jgi:hypothetical protein